MARPGSVAREDDRGKVRFGGRRRQRGVLRGAAAAAEKGAKVLMVERAPK